MIKYLDSFLEYDCGDVLVIVLEWAGAGDLQRQLAKLRANGVKLPQRVIWRCFSQICGAIAHMHEKRVLHRESVVVVVVVAMGKVRMR